MKEILDILVIEDNEKHLEDAKKYFSGLTREPSVRYARTYVEAMKDLDETVPDGIISDIFFPYDENGMSEDARTECLNIIDSEDVPERFRSRLERLISGEHMHPTGVLVVDYAIKEDIPRVLCTDTNHHGTYTSVVVNYCYTLTRKGIDVPLVDADPKDIYEGTAAEKDWKCAFRRIVSQLVRKEMGISMEQHSDMFRRFKKTPEQKAKQKATLVNIKSKVDEYVLERE